MVDLKGQYEKIKKEIDHGIIKCVESTKFINGPGVKEFAISLASYLNVSHVIPCANGTDALQIALMALDLKPGDEVICPAFTYVATAEVIGLLGLVPVMADVCQDTFNIDVSCLEELLTEKTKAIIPVHLYGQSCDMEPLLSFAKNHNLFVVEDNAQAIGAEYKFSDGSVKKTGTMGDIGTTSFFPSKNLGCYGDGGALMTNNDDLALKIRMIANHGQEKKYYHKVLGCNSRLDSIQAAILNIKLRYLDTYSNNRNRMANFYFDELSSIEGLILPVKSNKSTHVFHQFTVRVEKGRRDSLKNYLYELGIPSMIYYPLPLYKQEAFKKYVPEKFNLKITESHCEEVLSLPMHTELNQDNMDYICKSILNYFNGNE